MYALSKSKKNDARNMQKNETGDICIIKWLVYWLRGTELERGSWICRRWWCTGNIDVTVFVTRWFDLSHYVFNGACWSLGHNRPTTAASRRRPLENGQRPGPCVGHITVHTRPSPLSSRILIQLLNSFSNLHGSLPNLVKARELKTAHGHDAAALSNAHCKCFGTVVVMARKRQWTNGQRRCLCRLLKDIV